MQVLVLEASTTSAKAMRYDEEKGVMEVQGSPYPPKVNHDGLHEMQGVFDALLQVGRRVAEGHTIEAVALVGTYHDALVCDEDFTPQTPVYTWASPLGGGVTRRLRANVALSRQIYQNTGCMVNTTYPLYKMIQLAEEGMRFEGRLVMDEESWIFHRLTGVAGAGRSALSGSGFMDINALEYSKLTLPMAGIDEKQMLPFLKDDATAPLLGEMAGLLGVQAGIPVVLGQPDGAMNQLGAGALQKGVMTLSVGTSAAARMVRDNAALAGDEGTWCYYAPTTWLGGVATAGAASCVDWFMREFGGGESYAGLEAGLEVEADSPYFMPFLYGERCPGWHDDLLGGFAGLAGRHTRQQLFGAVLEGTLLCLYQSYLALQRSAGAPDVILLSGGAAKSAVWRQMAADIWQREMQVQATEQASMLGGAVMALYATGRLARLEDFGKGQAPKLVVRPRDDRADFYRRRYEGYLRRYTAEVALLQG